MCVFQDPHVSDSSSSLADMERMSRNKMEHGRQMHQVLQVSWTPDRFMANTTGMLNQVSPAWLPASVTTLVSIIQA